MIADARLLAIRESDLFTLETIDRFVVRMSHLFKTDNPRFDASRFIIACHKGDL